MIIDAALLGLQDRIKALNGNPDLPYTVSEAVAFGDFLLDRPRLQAPNVGVGLSKRQSDMEAAAKVRDHPAELAFFKQLRSKSATLHLRQYEPWMRTRLHRKLLNENGGSGAKEK